MFGLNFSELDPMSPIAVIGPSHDQHTLLITNISRDGAKLDAIKQVGDVKKALGPIARRFGKLCHVYPNLPSFLKDSEEINIATDRRYRYGHIDYRDRSVVKLKGRRGTVRLMVPVINR